MKKQTLLFDFDGTLIDSQGIIQRYVEHLFKEYQVILSEEENFATQGMSITSFAQWIEKHKKIVIPEEELTVTDPNYLERIQPFPGIQSTLALLKSKKYKMAIVSNSPREYVELLLRKYNLEHYFGSVITEDEAPPKPNPQMLSMAMNELEVTSEDCVMIDDNAPGIEAANNLGIYTVRIGKEQGAANERINSVEELLEILEK